jgi:hypothetical protein
MAIGAYLQGDTGAAAALGQFGSWWHSCNYDMGATIGGERSSLLGLPRLLKL